MRNSLGDLCPCLARQIVTSCLEKIQNFLIGGGQTHFDTGEAIEFGIDVSVEEEEDLEDEELERRNK